MDVLVAVPGSRTPAAVLPPKLKTSRKPEKPPKPKWLHPNLLSIVILCEETRQQAAVIEV